MAMKSHYLVGKEFGKLTVVSFAKKILRKIYWNCLCSCGNENIVPTNHLISGHTTSCGCSRHEVTSLVGQRFGKLIVISFAEMRDGYSFWTCLCDCGVTKIIRGTQLTQGNTNSCGCNNKWLDLAGKKFGRWEVLSFSHTADNSYDKYWFCRCECGTERAVFSKSLIYGRSFSCGCFKGSKLELIVKDVLIRNNIEFIYQYSIPSKSPKGKHSYILIDFLLKYKNKQIAIECQGKQHYKGYTFGSKTLTKEESLNDCRERDARKKSVLISMDIPLIEIPYWEENIETFLMTKLKEIVNDSR